MKPELSPFIKKRQVTAVQFHQMQYITPELYDLVFSLNPDIEDNPEQVLSVFNSMSDEQKNLLYQRAQEQKAHRKQQEMQQKQMELMDPRGVMEMEMLKKELEIKKKQASGELPPNIPTEELMNNPGQVESEQPRVKWYQVWKKDWWEERRHRKELERQKQEEEARMNEEFRNLALKK